jgi:methylated-DNA-[protein]-cysteine S-methyltransferase
LPQLSFHSPVGDLTLFAEDGAIIALEWGWGAAFGETNDQHAPLLREAQSQLNAYFDGARSAFSLPLAPSGTPYRKRVWNALATIAAGYTVSYADLARQIGGSPRSIGGAMGANPIPILIPCHRVVATSGQGGYSGGEGLPTKLFLLALERRTFCLPSTDQPSMEFQ